MLHIVLPLHRFTFVKLSRMNSRSNFWFLLSFPTLRPLSHSASRQSHQDLLGYTEAFIFDSSRVSHLERHRRVATVNLDLAHHSN